MLIPEDPESGSWFFTHPGSRIQESKRHRIPDPQHCVFALFCKGWYRWLLQFLIPKISNFFSCKFFPNLRSLKPWIRIRIGIQPRMPDPESMNPDAKSCKVYNSFCRVTYSLFRIVFLCRICPRLNRKVATFIPDFEPAPPPQEERREFPCTLCGKNLSTKSALRKHVSLSLATVVQSLVSSLWQEALK